MTKYKAFEPIPAHFFKKGPYQVWAHKYYGQSGPLLLIAENLCLESAKAFNWPHAEIRINKHHYLAHK